MLIHNLKPCIVIAILLIIGSMSFADSALTAKPMLLERNKLKSYVEKFNADDTEYYKNTYPNSKAYDFLKANIPLFECPDKEIEKIYYFRWWTYRKHVRKTEGGFVVTEFLPPVGHSKNGVISCPAGHQFREGRWLHDTQIMRDYMNLYLTKPEESQAHRYNWWAGDSILAVTAVHPNDQWLTAMLDPLIRHHQGWNRLRVRPNELYAQIDWAEGEFTVGGRIITGQDTFTKKVLMVRPSFNSMMYSNALAISEIAKLVGKKDIQETYQEEASHLKELIQTRLWNDELKFFTVLPPDYTDDSQPIDVREWVGFSPWYFNLPDGGQGYEVAWEQLMDPKGFYAPFGPTTCEQRHPFFTVEYHKYGACQFNGPSWPFSTCHILTALANLLNNYQQEAIGKKEYFETLKIYTKSHAFREIPPASDTNRKAIVKEDLPWIDENLDPYTGNWLTRYRLNRGEERGKDYNHSTYCDLIINGLVGLRPQRGNQVIVNPLVPEDQWDWFCLDNVLYHGRLLTIIWDKTGNKYDRGKGLIIFADGMEIARSSVLSKIIGSLPVSR